MAINEVSAKVRAKILNITVKAISLGFKPARSIWLKNFNASSAGPLLEHPPTIAFHEDSSLLGMVSQLQSIIYYPTVCIQSNEAIPYRDI